MSSELVVVTASLAEDDVKEPADHSSAPHGKIFAPVGKDGIPPAVSGIAIRASGLSKCYQIYETPRDRFKQFVVPRLQRLAGMRPSRYFREFWAIQNISLEVGKGETVGIVGRNGSGKSTLLQIICGTLTPTSGSAETHGRIAALLELGSGFNYEFTGVENIYMYGMVLGLTTHEIDTRFDDITSFADIGDFIYRPIKTYSSGMVMRLAFAVAINTQPDILVVDEALSVGDESFQRKCFAWIERLKEAGSTILFVSHSARDVVALCDRALLLEAGRLSYEGTPKNVINAYHARLYSAGKVDGRTAGNGATGSSAVGAAHELVSDDETGFFDPDLVSASAVVYPSNGMVISNVSVVDQAGSRRNVLKAGMTYSVSYDVEAETDLNKVVFGFHLKNTAGVEVGGISYPSNQDGVDFRAAQSPYTVTFPFTARLFHGDYFLTVGVRSHLEDTFRHRIADVIRLKVLPERNPGYFGLCDLRPGDSGARLESRTQRDQA